MRETLTSIGIACMIVGCIPLIIGWKSYPKNKPLILSSLMIILGGIFTGIFINPSSDMPNGSPFMSAVGIILVLVGIVKMALSIKKTNVQVEHVKKTHEQEIAVTPIDRFFIECVLADATDFNEQKNLERAKLFAEKYKLNLANGIPTLFEEGKTAHALISGRREAVEMKALKDQEKNLSIDLNLYAEYYGKDKKITMLTHEINRLRNQANLYEKNKDMLWKSGQQKELDWATMGGIADGIAGFGAGVSTALDVQAKNAVIRAQNEANTQRKMPTIMAMGDRISSMRSQASNLEKEIERVKEKLIASDTTEEVFSYLNISEPSYAFSKSGAIYIAVTAEEKTEPVIFGDVAAYVDGSIIAHVWNGEKEIGTANLVFPKNGAQKKQTLEGIILEGGEADVTYQLTFTPGKLWLMEK